MTVSGAHPHTSTAAIVDAAGLDGHPPLISVDPGATAARVERLPFIASAQVHRHWPDGVTVSVTERVPKAVMAGPARPGRCWTAYGRTLAVDPGRPPGFIVVTVETPDGPARPGKVGTTLPGADSFALTVCRTLPLAFSAQVVSVTEAANATVSLGLNSGITVLLGTDSDMAAKYEDVAAVIAHASLHGADDHRRDRSPVPDGVAADRLSPAPMLEVEVSSVCRLCLTRYCADRIVVPNSPVGTVSTFGRG